MKFASITTLLTCIFLPSVATAQVPRVVSDIPTTHSLVATVMGGLGEPALLMRASASPHDYALRPSEAASLEAADIVFWTSEQLTPWLSRAVRSLAPDATSIELMESSGTTVLGFRDSIEHTHEQDEHTKRLTDEPEYDSEHDSEHDSKYDPENAIDPHGWLDPVNAQHWLGSIAAQLAVLDPDNADTYRENAKIEIRKIEQLILAVNQQLDSIESHDFIVFHDSYRYFEERFNFHSTAAISLADGEHPGIARLDSLSEILANHAGACVFAEPQFSRRLIRTISGGQTIKMGVLDPLGAQIPPGPELYRDVISQLANSFSDCLGEP